MVAALVLKLATIGFAVSLCNVWRLPHLSTRGVGEGSCHITYAFLLVITGRCMNIFLKPRLKEWITQLWQDAQAARSLSRFLLCPSCSAGDSIHSSFHHVANGSKSNGKVLIIVGAFVCGAVLIPFCQLFQDASPQTFMILTIGLGISVVFTAHTPPLSQAMMCCASSRLLFCCSLLCADLVTFCTEHMEYISIKSFPASEVDTCQKLPFVCCNLHIVILILLAIIILEGHDNGVESTKHGAGCTNTQLRRLSTKIDHIPYKVMSRICCKLDIKRDMHFDDFRMLGEKAGLDRDLINCIAQYENPTQKILMEWSSRPETTVGKLIELLKEDDLGRMDVAKVLEDWVNGEQ